ncbi:RNA-directed RNA polymerase [ssRNA phage SRR7976325_18]|uniref:RNA-directed RNA polymerase n=1 Tax=ssRNA phage SRR7976325_18 TaxID=2786705 RepID=A0A8S5L0T7_9VIRU|nr:RNA-directed RNA polymerase [ssRNA phage SRR7976325_18]DAD51208.1 TPA_asm: RNA-directed RNA polymerase [ssRNA phage SRR7976325_18]
MRNYSPFKDEKALFMSLCEAVDTPRAQACYILARAGEWSQYIDLPPADPDRPSFADDYLVSEAMTKNPNLPLDIDRERVALRKFLESEEQCRQTNSRFKQYEDGTFLIPERINAVLCRASRIISRTLGTLTRPVLESIERHMRFGPGATSAVSGQNVVLSNKMTSRLDVTPRLYPYARSILGPVWASAVTDINLVASSQVCTVPKNAKTDRCICIEPHLNIYVQLGIGAIIRQRLIRSGIQIAHQEQNRFLSSKASQWGLATLDLSSASDTLSRSVVWNLLPPDWAALLDLARTEFTVIDDQELRLEKFSSMGNGYTFELETLIFASLAEACGANLFNVFGDDIIVERDVVPLLREVLEFCGFSTNMKKSFWQGDFFESCGTDWWRGIDVRPIFFRSTTNDKTSFTIRIANAIRRYAHRRGSGHYCDRRFLRSWIRAISLDPRARKTGVPPEYGDAGLTRNFDEFTPRRYGRGWSGWRGKIWSGAPPRSRRTSHAGAYLAALAWGTPGNSIIDDDGATHSSRLFEPVRGDPGRPALRTLHAFTWSDLGPWA